LQLCLRLLASKEIVQTLRQHHRVPSPAWRLQIASEKGTTGAHSFVTLVEVERVAV